MLGAMAPISLNGKRDVSPLRQRSRSVKKFFFYVAEYNNNHQQVKHSKNILDVDQLSLSLRIYTTLDVRLIVFHKLLSC